MLQNRGYCCSSKSCVHPRSSDFSPKPYLSKLSFLEHRYHFTIQATNINSTSSRISSGKHWGTEFLSITYQLSQACLPSRELYKVEKPIFKSTIDYDQLISANHGRQLPNQGHLRNSDIATIQFTSGTTSAPKAACLSHKSILNNGFLVGRGMDLTERDIVCCPPPLYHCFGLVLGLLAVMTHGICSSFYKCPTHSLKNIFDCEQKYQVLTVRKEHASYCHRKHLTQERSLDQSKTIDQPPSMVSRQCFSPSWNCFPKGCFTSIHLMFIH
jgi:acyl-CoA synthetase (AMP-forming)/AMP-acid ligase II